jgi:hypothetical protein
MIKYELEYYSCSKGASDSIGECIGGWNIMGLRTEEEVLSLITEIEEDSHIYVHSMRCREILPFDEELSLGPNGGLAYMGVSSQKKKDVMGEMVEKKRSWRFSLNPKEPVERKKSALKDYKRLLKSKMVQQGTMTVSELRSFRHVFEEECARINKVKDKRAKKTT